MAPSLASANRPFCAVANKSGNMVGNHMLAALVPEEMRRLREHLELVTLPRRATLHEAGGRTNFAYFPTSSVISMVHVMSDGDSAEVGVIGNEGFTGVTSLLGGAAPLRVAVRSAGQAFRIKLAPLHAEFQRHGRLHRIALRYASAAISQLAQVAGCYRRHSVDQQLSRWLLSGIDRAASNELLTTQESIASMLGVRREGVTEAASAMQKAGLIRYSRGRIAVVSRSKLEARACECYRLLRADIDRLVRDVYGVRL
jgi:CRP-like cAMP-binding protein